MLIGELGVCVCVGGGGAEKLGKRLSLSKLEMFHIFY